MIRASSMQTASVRWRRRARYAGGSSAPTARCSYSQKPPEPTTSSASPRSPPSATAAAATGAGSSAPPIRAASHGNRPAIASPQCTAPPEARSTAPQASAMRCASSRAA